MVRDIMIVGAGGWGREAAWTLERINAREMTWNILGFADDDPAKATGSVEGYPLLGNVEKASHDHPGAAVYIAIGDNAVRESIYRRLRGHDFPVIIDPSADVAPTAEMRHGVFVGPQAVLPVPVKVLACPAFVDVVRMIHIELAVIVLWVIDAVLSRTAIVTGHPLLCCSHGITSVSHFFFAVAFFISE